MAISAIGTRLATLSNDGSGGTDSTYNPEALYFGADASVGLRGGSSHVPTWEYLGTAVVDRSNAPGSRAAATVAGSTSVRLEYVTWALDFLRISNEGWNFDASSLPICRRFQDQGNNAISGDLIAASVAGHTEFLSCQGQNTVSGNIDAAPHLTYVQITGANTLGGDTSNCPNVTYWGVTGGSGGTLAIDLTTISNACTHIDIKGAGRSINGTLPLRPSVNNFTSTVTAGNGTVDLANIPNVNLLYCAGAVSVTGSVDNVDPASLFWILSGGGTIAGDVDSLNRSGSIQVWNNNTLSGSIANLVATTVDIRGANTCDISTIGPNLNTCGTWRFFNKTTAEVDAFLISLSATTKNTGTRNVFLNDASVQPRSAASDAAVAALQGLGWTINTN